MRHLWLPAALARLVRLDLRRQRFATHQRTLVVPAPQLLGDVGDTLVRRMQGTLESQQWHPWGVCRFFVCICTHVVCQLPGDRFRVLVRKYLRAPARAGARARRRLRKRGVHASPRAPVRIYSARAYTYYQPIGYLEQAMPLPKSRASQRRAANSLSTKQEKPALAVTPVRVLTEKDKKRQRERAQLQYFNEKWRAEINKAAPAGCAGNSEKSSTKVYCTKCMNCIFASPLVHFNKQHR